MPLNFSLEHSHRWFLNFEQWIYLFDNNTPLDRLAFENGLRPDLSSLKNAYLYYVAQREAYLLHMNLISEAVEIPVAEWETEVTSITEPIMAEFLQDVLSLHSELGLRLSSATKPLSSLALLPSSPSWTGVLHELENQTVSFPRSRDVFVAWLDACLGLKLAEEIQSIRRAVLGFWLIIHCFNGNTDQLANLITANTQAFAWRISEFVNSTIVPEKKDPRTGKRLSWPATKTDHVTVETHPMFGRKIVEQPVRSLGRTVHLLFDTVVHHEGIHASRRFFTCPRKDIFAKIESAFAHLEDAGSTEDVYRVFCKFCYMHAFSEAVRNIPKFFVVQKFEHVPYHGQNSRCVFLWDFELIPTALLGFGGDRTRSDYVKTVTAVPPPIRYLSQLDDILGKDDLRRTVWDGPSS
jgi:hypothetical protein